MNEVSHGSERFQLTPSRIQRTDRNRVSSILKRLVGVGSGSHRAAAAMSALCAVGHDTRTRRRPPTRAVGTSPQRTAIDASATTAWSAAPMRGRSLTRRTGRSFTRDVTPHTPDTALLPIASR
jgi:hypothetical protein